MSHAITILLEQLETLVHNQAIAIYEGTLDDKARASSNEAILSLKKAIVALATLP